MIKRGISIFIFIFMFLLFIENVNISGLNLDEEVIEENRCLIYTENKELAFSEINEVKVFVSPNSNISSFQFSLKYNYNVLEIMGAKVNQDLNGLFTCNLDNLEKIIVTYTQDSNITDEVELFTIQVKVKDTSKLGDSYSFILDNSFDNQFYSTIDSQSVLVNNVDFNFGFLQIGLCGDTNGDGLVNISDVILIKMKIENKIYFTPQMVNISDVNKNGIIELDDASKIQMYLAGLVENLDFNYYTITFNYDNYRVVYNVKLSGALLSIPEPKRKIGFVSKWSLEDFTNISSDKVVEAVYEIDYNSLNIIGDERVLLGENILLSAIDEYSTDNIVSWETSDESILIVDGNGLVTGVSEGRAFVIITSLVTGISIQKEIIVEKPAPLSVEIKEITFERITFSANLILEATVLPLTASQDIIWTSSDKNIATINENGEVNVFRPGQVTITAKTKNHDISAEITFTVEPTPMEILSLLHNENPIYKNIRVYGSDLEYSYNLYTSVNDYLNQNLNITESLVSISMNNRPGMIKESTKYITIHDTALATSYANAYSHDSYVRNGGGGTSWHYIVGNDGIYHNIPDDEVAYHAGDGSRKYVLEDTGVLATSNEKPTFTISIDGYYQLDGVKSLIKTPLDNSGAILDNSKINEGGFEVVIGENGNWWMGKTWYSSTYKKLGNYGGNRNSIGLESCINQGSDIYLTWQKLAKLVASLMEEHIIDLDHVVQHNYFSGKNCPGTMRGANMWQNFLELVEAEYLVKTYLKDYNITFITNCPNYIDNRGRIVRLPTAPLIGSYNVKITDEGGNLVEEKLFYVNLPARS